MTDEFLSEEDLDPCNLSWEELLAWWDLGLHQAQATNDLDEHTYSHGVFRTPFHTRGRAGSSRPPACKGWRRPPTNLPRSEPAGTSLQAALFPGPAARYGPDRHHPAWAG